MKITQDHYAILLGAFKSTLLAEVERLKGFENMPQSVKALVEHHAKGYQQEGLTERRMHFDLFWWVNRRAPEVGQVMPAIYKYANDDHLHTALKAIVRELQA